MNIQKIMELTPDEVLLAAQLKELAEEAKKLSVLIRETYRCFAFGEDKITVWTEAGNYEYLTYAGVWQARYLRQSYDIDCTPEGIFNILKTKYFFDAQELTDCERKEMEKKFKYFEAFVERTKERANKEIKE